MTPAVLWSIQRLRIGPPSLVTFLPAFWFLAPGAAGLIGVTEMVGTDSALGLADFTDSLGTVIEIASASSSAPRLSGRRGRIPGSHSNDPAPQVTRTLLLALRWSRRHDSTAREDDPVGGGRPARTTDLSHPNRVTIERNRPTYVRSVERPLRTTARGLREEVQMGSEVSPGRPLARLVGRGR